MPKVVYRATSSESVDRYLEERAAVEAKFQAECAAYQLKTGASNLHGIDGYTGSFYVLGISFDGPMGDLPLGWRRDGKHNRAVPAKRTPEGKAIEKELHAIYRPERSYPGFPNAVRGEGFRIYPYLETIAGTHYMLMSREPFESDPAALSIDADLWQREKLSEFHAAREAAE